MLTKLALMFGLRLGLKEEAQKLYDEVGSPASPLVNIALPGQAVCYDWLGYFEE